MNVNPALVLCLGCLASFITHAQGAALRVLPLGDSITQSDYLHYSYRYPLWRKFIDANVAVDFIGSLNTNYGGNPSFPSYGGQSFDTGNEGHWGWRTDEVLNGLNSWLPGYMPDVVLLNLGTNDTWQGQSVASTVDELKQIITKLRGRNPNVKVLISNLTPKTDAAENAREKPLNDQIPGIASSMTTAQSPIVFVDQFSGFNASADTSDGVHPNASGEEKMAQRWFAALNVQGPNPTPPIQQIPYLGSPFAIPGKVTASQYDHGGEGVSFHDTDAVNQQSSTFRPGYGVDSSGSGVGWVYAGEWLEYTVNVISTGTYTLTIPVCHQGTGGSMHVSFSGTNVTGALTVPNTGSWSTFQNIVKTVSLNAGSHIMQVVFDTADSAGYGPGLGDIVISSGGGSNNPPSVTLALGGYEAVLLLTANASDSDGSVTKVDFYEGSTLLGTDATSPFTFTWVNPPPGSHSVHAKATDNGGAVGTSNTVTFEGSGTTHQQTPYSGAPVSIPGTIETAKFDNGGEGVAFHDTDSVNQQSNTWRPGLGVDSPGSGVGWIYAGEWLEYTVNVSTAGTYTLTIPVCHQGNGGSMHVSFGGANVTGSLSVPNTGSWSTFQNITKSVTLSAGTQVMQVVFDTADSAGYGPGLGDIVIIKGPHIPPGVQAPYNGTPMAIPGTIHVAQYDKGGEGSAYHDVDAINYGSSSYRPGEGVDSVGSGVGWIVGSEWLEYTVTVNAAGDYTITIPVSQMASGSTMHVNFNGANVTGTLNVPNTGNWNTQQNVTANVTLNAGTQIMQVAFDANASNGYGPGLGDITIASRSTLLGNQTPYNGTPMNLHGTIRVAQYDNGGEGVAYHDTDSVNQMSSTYRPGSGVDSNGNGVGWISAGEWLEYTLSVPAPTLYYFRIPVSHPGPGGTMHISFNDVNKSGTLSIPNTGSWDTYQYINSQFRLEPGTYVMQVMFDTNGSTGYGPGLGDITVVMPTPAPAANG